ncbi:MAG: hypothetical protein U0X20_32705 [Caldilineaceae bacterium]
MSSLSQLLDNYPGPVRALVAELSALIKSVAPGAREAVRLETRCLRYSHARCGYFCGLYPQVSSAQLLFEFGVLLPDPEGLLEGDGPHVRFVTVWANQRVRTVAIRRLIAAAYDLPRKRADKLELVDALAAQCQYDDLLERAVLHGTVEDVRQALAVGANPQGRPYELPPLFRACLHRADDCQRHEIVRLLLAAGADIDCEYNGRSLLSNVERLGRPDLVRLLIECGARQEEGAPLHAEVPAATVPIGAATRTWPQRAFGV